MNMALIDVAHIGTLNNILRKSINILSPSKPFINTQKENAQRHAGPL